MWRDPTVMDFDDASMIGSTTSPSRQRDGRRRRPSRRGKERVDAAEDDEEQTPPAEEEAPTSEVQAPLAAKSDTEVPPAGAVSAVPESPAPAVTMGVADNYDNMEDAEKRCFEAFIMSQMDSSLVNYLLT